MISLRALLMADDAVEQLQKLDHEGKLKTLEPSLAALRMKPLPGVRHKDNLTHSIRVLANAIEREGEEKDLILRTAALFHDVGKPATRHPNASSKTVDFNGHETVGAKQVWGILKRHDYSRSEIEAVSQLVLHHMRSHNYSPDLWTASAIRRLLADVPDKRQLERLIVIFYSDVTTSKPALREKIHRGIDELQASIEEVIALDARAAQRPAIDGHRIMEEFGLKPGPQLGKIMRFLNSDEGIVLSEAEALAWVKAQL